MPTDGKLLSQGQVLDGKASLGNEHCPEKHCFEQAHTCAFAHLGIGYSSPMAGCIAIVVTP